MFRQIRSLSKTPSPGELYAALLELYRFSFLLIVGPIFVLSLVFSRAMTFTQQTTLVYLALCLPLCGLAFYLAERGSSLNPLQNAFQQAMRLALVPALPAAFGVVLLSGGPVGQGMLISSLVLYVLLLTRLKTYSQRASEASALEQDPTPAALPHPAQTPDQSAAPPAPENP